jgi:acyl-homoserine-lactone acylase
LDDVIKIGDSSPDSLTRAAAAVLKTWDRHTDTASKGAVLFVQMCFMLDPDSVIKNPYDAHDPLHTPNGVKSPNYAAKKLKQAATITIQKFGRLDVPWGKVFRFRSGDVDLPANGCFSFLGSYRAIDYRPAKNNTFTADGGDSYVAITEFGARPKAVVSLSYGNASQKGSKHSSDQLKLMSEKKLRAALLSKADVLKNLEEREEVNSH